MVTERNLCHESGCPDLCCKNKFFVAKREPALSEEELRLNFPNVRKLPSLEDVKDILWDGLYRIGKSGRIYYLKGRCPHNFPMGCNAPLKPHACKEGFPFGEKICNDLRRKAHLPESETSPST